MAWEPLQGLNTGIVAIHAALLPTSPHGDILCFGDWAGSGAEGVIPLTLTRLYSVGSESLEPEFNDEDLPDTNAFCGGQAFLADGRLLVAGGTLGWPEEHAGLHDAHYDGERACWVYLPRERRWVRVMDLRFQPNSQSNGGGRWYPTLVALANGEVIAIAGHPSDTDDYNGRHNNNTPERYSPPANWWTLMSADVTAPNSRNTDSYPRYHLLPSGLLFCDTSGKESPKRLFDPWAGVWTGPDVDTGQLPGYYDVGSAATSVLLPLLPPNYPARVLACNSPHNSAFRIDIDAAPQWLQTPQRQDEVTAKNRENGCATLLPTGQVLLTGGWPRDTDDDIATATRTPELYIPGINWSAGDFSATANEEWLDMSAAAETAEIGRGYHSVALLLPDGRVWTAGSTTKSVGAETGIEIYDPPYVGSSRPTVSGAPASVGYGIKFNVTVDRDIERVALMRCGSITHGFDSDQRYVGLTFSQDDDELTITAPPNGLVAPPGYYMLWVVDSSDRPCDLAPFVRLSNQQLLLYTDRSTFSVHEVNASGLPAHFFYSFYVILEGVLPHEAGDPIEPPDIEFIYPGGDPVPGMAYELATSKWEDPATPPDVAQRLTFAFHIRFDIMAAFDQITGASDDILLRATHGAFTATASLVLSKNPNPWMRDGDIQWLSTDVRVFQIQPGMTKGGVEHGSGGGAPFDFIQALVAKFEQFPPDESHPFLNELEVDQELSALTFAKEAANGEPVYNYAVAKVRMKAPPEVTADDVGVFFRLFTTASTGFEYNSGTYARNGSGTSAYPVLGKVGGDIATIPFFAQARAPEGDAQVDTTNRKSITGTGALEAHRYFGCWLDINQETPVFEEDGATKSIQEILKGEHQCLVAELDYALDPIPANSTPGSNENLSQRNLIIALAPNPAGPATRVVAHTLEITPSKTPAQLPQVFGGTANGSTAARLVPDEIVFSWRNVPLGTQVTLYMPDVDAEQVLALAARRQGPPMLARVDDHTLRLTVGGITYVPIPGGRTRTIPALVTMQLPPDLVKGTVYKATVKQFEGRRRRILGSVQITIPITTGEEILPEETRKLAVLRHIASKLATTNKWYPIFERYLGLIGDRVRGLGGDPDAVEPSPTGNPPHPRPEPEPGRPGFTGKVSTILYDCFGDFEGFVIESCDACRRFKACERGVEAVVKSACQDRNTITVSTDDRSGRISGIVVHCC